ncbi:polysaccharide pyruvyl transferase family protein [Brachybacterium sp. YJGR34]|uniref:polysaccharide pyruvyl transferase family protein n=1 Tax=Brachybacterium sp. YJGR34 TaxID=2059911 RepID=UPI0013006B75|nr:polysaccharide pyruvyl transferase family protein [Brachybacterium sp. YJGR34]
MVTAILFYEHVASNWGDLAINTGAEELLRRAGADVENSSIVRMRPGEAYSRLASLSAPGLRVHDLPLAGVPKGGAEEYAQLADALENPRRFAEDIGILDHDVVLLNAGEHLFEAAHGGNLTDLLWRLLPAIAAVHVGRPVILLPSTIGPFLTGLGREIDRFLDSSLSASAFRDAESQRMTGTQWDSDAPLLLDPGFFAAGERSGPRHVDVAERVGLVLRLEDAGLRSGSRRSSYVQAKNRASGFVESQAFRLFREVAARILRDGRQVSLTIQTRADREITAALHDSLQQEFGPDSITLNDPSSYEEYLAAISEVDLLITSRFHTVILGETRGVPSVGIYSGAHGHKMPGLMGVLGKPTTAVRLDDRLPDLTADEVMAAAADALDAADAVYDRIDALQDTTAAWFGKALRAPARIGATAVDLRLSALAALTRTGTELAAERDIADLRRSVQKLTRLMTEE